MCSNYSVCILNEFLYLLFEDKFDIPQNELVATIFTKNITELLYLSRKNSFGRQKLENALKKASLTARKEASLAIRQKASLIAR
jgi:hypothetical protein